MVPASFHDFFNGCASVAGALIGLLFVALSVSQEKLTGDDARTEHQVRAAAAFSALVNTLVIALVGLLPLASLGQAGIVLAGAVPGARDGGRPGRGRPARRTSVIMGARGPARDDAVVDEDLPMAPSVVTSSLAPAGHRPAHAHAWRSRGGWAGSARW